MFRKVISLGEFSHCGQIFFNKEIGKIRFKSVNSRKKCSIYGIFLTKFTNHKIEKKKRKKRESRKNTDNICMWYIPGTNIMPSPNQHLFWYQLTNALCLLLIIKKCGCNSLLPIHSLDKKIHYFLTNYLN